MEVNELMIGDWIHKKIYLDGANKKPYEEDIQVRNIYGSEVNCKIKDYTIVSGVYLDDIEPIPLTPEILKKNKFEYTKVDKFYLDKEGYISIKIPPDAGDAEIIIGDGVNYIHVLLPYKEYLYVHELQHALRLCGFNKLADNFKV